MKNAQILIVDDESSFNSSLARVFEHHGYPTTILHSHREFEEKGGSGFDVAFLDLRLPDGDGLELMHKLKLQSPKTQVIIMTGYGTIDLAVEATKKGAFHFITKPFNAGEILNLAARALTHSRLKAENTRLKSFVKKQYQFDKIIGNSRPLLHLIETVKKIASSSSTVLITGESGTGKELIARSLHLHSECREGPFVPVHCGAIPKELLESELFGHIKGSFTGAIKDRVGRFQMAEAGTLFLDEISTMDQSMQIKLLRVLQEREFQPVGSEKIFKSQARVIAASNEDLDRAVRLGHFRKDLFYRLNVIPLYVPPLRQRVEDIPLLVTHFIRELNKKKTNKLKGFSEGALSLLTRYAWPGNIRELENLVERLCVLKQGDFVTEQDLPPVYFKQAPASSSAEHNLAAAGGGMTPSSQGGEGFYNQVESFENHLILKALKKTGWNRNQAAKLLKLNRTTLLEKIKKKGLKEENRPTLFEPPPSP